MKKEPLFLYIFQIFLKIALVAFLVLLYWSSLVVEEKSQETINTLLQLKSEIEELKEISRQQSLGNAPLERPEETPKKEISVKEQVKEEFPNLLEKDPFYEKTLPKLLGQGFKPQGTFHSSTIGKPASLHPFSNWADVGNWTGMCSVSVARGKFGKYETYAPDMAIRMEQRFAEGTKVPEFWIFLRKGVYWQPLSKALFSEDIALAPHFLKKHLVTAHDFKFFFDALSNPYNQEPGAVAFRTFYGDLVDLHVIDDFTFTVRWKTKEVEEGGQKVKKIKYLAKALTGGLKPLASFLYKYFPDGSKIVEEDGDPNTYRTSSLWAQNFSQHWAKNVIPSCGAWNFQELSDTQISFKRNKEFYLPYEVLAAATETQFRDTMEAVWQDFKSNKIDTYTLQPDKVLELEQFLKTPTYLEQVKQGNAIKRLAYLSRSYTYVGWNQAKPYFKSSKVRTALTMAINRQRIIREYLNGMGEEITGTFYKYSPNTDSSIIPLPYDIQKAKRLLEEEGWYDSDGDGVIDKEIEGKKVPFTFHLTYYVKNTISKSICEYIATALKDIGIICNLNGVDIADLSSAFDDKSFDAILLTWALGTPPEEPRQLWHSFGAKEKGSSNAVGFANAKVDEIIDTLEYEYDVKKRQQLYHRFNKILYDEQPYTFLYSPKSNLLYREYVQNVFIPAERQDLVPGANITTPDGSVFWLKKGNTFEETAELPTVKNALRDTLKQ